MPKWEIAIAVCDEPEAHRKKEGDVIAFNPAPWNWGKKELDQYLIVTIDGATGDEMVKLCVPLYEGGVTDGNTILYDKPVKIGKRKFKLPLNIIKNGWLPSLDTQKVRDKKLTYQPLKSEMIVIDTTEKVSIFLDKFTETYKYTDKKIAEVSL